MVGILPAYFARAFQFQYQFHFPLRSKDRLSMPTLPRKPTTVSRTMLTALTVLACLLVVSACNSRGNNGANGAIGSQGKGDWVCDAGGKRPTTGIAFKPRTLRRYSANLRPAKAAKLSNRQKYLSKPSPRIKHARSARPNLCSAHQLQIIHQRR